VEVRVGVTVGEGLGVKVAVEVGAGVSVGVGIGVGVGAGKKTSQPQRSKQNAKKGRILPILEFNDHYRIYPFHSGEKALTRESKSPAARSKQQPWYSKSPGRKCPERGSRYAPMD
jgi:hypothetical protein